VICDDGETQLFNVRQRIAEDVPFVSNKNGISFGVGCFQGDKKFVGEISQVKII
jgi:hypothetical protein